MEARIQKGDITLVIERSQGRVSIQTTYREGKLPAGRPPNPHTVDLSIDEFENMLHELDLTDE